MAMRRRRQATLIVDKVSRNMVFDAGGWFLGLLLRRRLYATFGSWRRSGIWTDDVGGVLARLDRTL